MKNLVLGIAMVSVGLLLMAGTAAAHGPSRQKVVETVDIAAPPAKVWGIIKNFNDMSWHPAVKSTDAPEGNTIGDVRTLDLGGPKLIEQLTKYDADSMTYSYKITNDPNNVKTLPDNSSIVEWRGAFYRGNPLGNPEPEMNDEAALKAVTGVYRGGLDNLKVLAEK